MSIERGFLAGAAILPFHWRFDLPKIFWSLTLLLKESSIFCHALSFSLSFTQAITRHVVSVVMSLEFNVTVRIRIFRFPSASTLLPFKHSSSTFQGWGRMVRMSFSTRTVRFGTVAPTARTWKALVIVIRLVVATVPTCPSATVTASIRPFRFIHQLHRILRQTTIRKCSTVCSGRRTLVVRYRLMQTLLIQIVPVKLQDSI